MKLERRKKEVWAEIIIYYDEYVYNKESTREPTLEERKGDRERRGTLCVYSSLVSVLQ